MLTQYTLQGVKMKSKTISRLKLACAVALLTAGSAANAELIQYSFTGADGQQHVKVPSDRYINAANTISFALSAGLDRKVRVSLLNSNGAVISTETSVLIGATDLITVNGKKYYGAILSLPKPPSDGLYTIKSETLRGDDGSVVKEEKFPITVDRTAPSSSSVKNTASGYGQTTTGAVWKLGRAGSEYNTFYVDNISDTSGIKEVSLSVLRQDGSLYRKRKINYDATTNAASISYNRDSTFFPSSNLDEDFKIQFEVVDNAGNIRNTPPQTVRYDNFVNPPSEPIGVFDPTATASLAAGLQGFVPYKAGMAVKTNPVRLAYRIPKSNWHTYAEGGIKAVNSLGENTVVGEDGSYVYLVISTPHNVFNNNYIRWSNFGEWGGGSITYNVKLASGVDGTPTLTNTEFHFSDTGWSSRYREINNKSLPITVDKIRISAEPRAYDQIATHGSGTCTIPKNQSSCVASVNLVAGVGTTGYWHSVTNIANASGTLRDVGFYGEVTWNDYYYPTISTSYDAKDFSLTAFVNQPSDGSYFNRLRNKDAWLEDASGKRLSVQGGKVGMVAGDYTYRWNLSTLPEGSYTLHAVTQANHGATTKRKVFDFVSDKTAPTLNIKTTGGSIISTLDQFLIEVTDSVDKEPKITNIRLEGGAAKDNVQLSWRKESSGVFRLEYPIMFPSLNEGESYTLTVSAVDAQGNSVTKEHTFEYTPTMIKMAGGTDGKIMIPAVEYEFTRRDGTNIIKTETVRMADDSVIQGSYDVLATLRSDSEVSLLVNGKLIKPGETLAILNKHNFAENEGRMDIPLSTAETGKIGKSNLLIMTTAPNSPVLSLEVQTWEGNAKLNSKSWEVKQVVDKVEIVATPDGIPCRLTTDEEEAKRSDVVLDPICLLEWEKTPDETTTVEYEGTGSKLTSLEGQAWALGEQEVSFSTYIFTGNGQKILIGSGSEILKVIPALDSSSYSTKTDVSKVSHTIQELFIQMKQDRGIKCNITLNSKEALEAGLTREVTNRNKVCFFEWSNIPNGLVQEQGYKIPTLHGSLLDEGEYDLGWRVSVYAKNGSRVTVAEESTKINAVPPSKPEITLLSSYKIDDKLYVVPVHGGYVGDIQVTSEASDLNVTIQNGSTVIENATFPPNNTGNKTLVTRRIDSAAADAWEKTTYNVSAHYEMLNGISSEVTFDVVNAPSNSVGAIISTEASKVVDTDKLPVEVKLADKINLNKSYDPIEMGEWNVRLVQKDRRSQEITPLTDYKKIDEKGSANFEVDLLNMTGNLNISAQAQLISPYPSYVREEFSNNLYLNVLYGGEVEAAIETRRMQGKAPMTTTIVLKANDRSQNKAIGSVEWQLSSDGGQTWESTVVNDRKKSLYRNTFPEGQYLIRAKVNNLNSDSSYITEQLQITAYNQPNLVIEGDTTVFVGDSAKITAKAVDGDGNEIKDAVIKWTYDKGETFINTGSEMTITNTESRRKSFEVWARAATADDNDKYSFSIKRLSVDFKGIKGPRIALSGQRVIEKDVEYTYSAQNFMPYKGMEGKFEIEGEFLLPDGSIVSGLTAKYTPSEEDVALGRVEVLYTAWIKGYRDQGAISTATYRPRVWEYVFPRFSLYANNDVKVAPTNGKAQLRALAFRGDLEEPNYEWSVQTAEGEPTSGLVFVGDTNSSKVSYDVLKEGIYVITAKVKDGRGNFAEAFTEMAFSKADPFVVDIKLGYSNSFIRAPLEVYMRPDVRGGHPRDRVDTYEFRENGNAIVDSSSRSAKVVLEAGEHTLKLIANTRNGEVLEKDVTITVAKNKPPVCEVISKELTTSWRVEANCDDPDGKVRTHDWTINGEKIALSSNRVTILKSTYDGALPLVTVVGYDDAGAASPEVSIGN